MNKNRVDDSTKFTTVLWIYLIGKWEEREGIAVLSVLLFSFLETSEVSTKKY